VARNVTIRVSDEALLWAWRKAAEENTSVSRLVGEMLERQMRLTDEYWRAYEHWKTNQPRADMGAAERLSREELHERRR
jgi:phosphatidylserine/phosphatidylglycerophosphate/cardiolipin synthase-like enzyme